MSKADVTVVIPTRDRASMSSQAISSALAQRGVEIELIVIDDGSTDETRRMLAEISDPRVRIERRVQPAGVAAARNRGLELARARWIAFLDDDDLWSPDWLAAAVGAGARDDAALVYSGRWLIDATRQPIGVDPAKDPKHLRESLMKSNTVGGPSAAVLDTETFRRAGGFDGRLSAFADWEAWLRLLRREGCHAAAVADFHIGYTVHAGNMHVRSPLGYRDELHRFSEIVRLASAGAASVDEANVVRWLAGEAERNRQRLAAARLWLDAARGGRRSDVIRAVRASMMPKARSVSEPIAAPEWLTAAH